MLRAAALLCLLLSLSVSATARASSTMDVGIADDGIMLDGSNAEIDDSLLQWRTMGIDTVRVFVRWAALVPGVNSRTRPAGFDPSDPDDPQYKWGVTDRAVYAIFAAGLKPIVTITGSGPCWGTSKPSQCNRGRHNPSPAAYAQFAKVVAEHYRAVVDTYILWNEPNQVLWLQPQATCKGRRCTPHSPHQYRKLVLAAEPKVREADPGSKILIGALAPDGSDQTARNKSMRPLEFLRAFGCVDRRYKRIRTGECRHFKAPTADGFAYHPHGIRLSPSKHAPNRDSAHIGDLSRLTRALDKITARGGLRPRGARRLPLYLTEFSYQTRPPDKYTGVTASLQSTYTQQGTYIAWRNSRVQNITQYVYVDEPMRAGGAGWQSGLRYVDGRAKTLLAYFPIPFWAQKHSGGRVQLWGQVRPGSGVKQVQLQRRSPSGAWVTIATVDTNPSGYYTQTITQTRATTYRAVTPSGATSTRFVTL